MLNMKQLIAKMLTAIQNVTQVTSYSRTSFTFNSGFTYYSASGTSAPAASKCGRVVMITGAYKSTSAQSDTSSKTIGKVPSGCEPLIDYKVLQQGSGQNRFYMTINTSGDIILERYGVTSNIAIPNNAWLNISCTYISKS